MKKILLILALTLTVTAQYKQFSTGTIAINDSNLVVDLGVKFGQDYQFVGFATDTEMTSTALTFQVYDEEKEQYTDFYNTSNSAVSYTVAANRFYQVDPDVFYGVRKFKMVFGTAEAAAREITIVKE